MRRNEGVNIVRLKRAGRWLFEKLVDAVVFSFDLYYSFSLNFVKF